MGAESYFVSVECGTATHSHKLVRVDETSFDLRTCAPLSGGITVKVYPFAEGYISPEPREIKVDKTALASPDEISVTGTVISWSENPDATGYELLINGETFVTNENSYDIKDIIGSESGVK